MINLWQNRFRNFMFSFRLILALKSAIPVVSRFSSFATEMGQTWQLRICDSFWITIHSWYWW